MTEKMNTSANEATNDGRSMLKKALIVLSIVEALTLIPVVLRMIFR